MRSAVAIGGASSAFLVLAVLSVVPTDDAYNDPDAVIVLGGGRERAQFGIEFARERSLPLVLSTASAAHGMRMGLRCGSDAYCLVPEPRSTRGEARGSLVVADELGWDRVLVVTTDLHTSRARLLFRQCFGERVAVIGVERPDPDLPYGLRLGQEAARLIVNATVQRAC